VRSPTLYIDSLLLKQNFITVGVWFNNSCHSQIFHKKENLQ
jgi:hypothetical protein